MRSTAGIVAGLFFVGIVANCGGNDTGGGPNGGAATTAGEGGDGPSTGVTGGSGGSATAGTMNAAGGADGGMPGTPAGCTKDSECGADAKCVKAVCKKDDGQACATADDCQNNCIDDVCTSGLPDGKTCAVDEDCAHTCIDNICAPASNVGGDCDVDAGAGGAGGASSAGVGGAGGDSSASQARDCAAPLKCFAGKCLTPDGEACKDNVDCVNTCNKSVCQPRQGLNGPCDDKSDCNSSALVCDAISSKCKLDLKQQCNDNAQCESAQCLCSNDTCSVRSCKTKDSTSCNCRWSPLDSASCNNSSAPVKVKSQDPNGCAGGYFCNGAGLCVVNNGGGPCVQKCKIASNGGDGLSGTHDDVCTSFQSATGCNSGYHGEIVADGDCKAVKTGATFQDAKGTHFVAVCQATCSCELNK